MTEWGGYGRTRTRTEQLMPPAADGFPLKKGGAEKCAQKRGKKEKMSEGACAAAVKSDISVDITHSAFGP